MFCITVDIWPHGNVKQTVNVVTIVGANDGTEVGRYGSYDAITVEGPLETPEDRYAARRQLIEAVQSRSTARVEHFPRGIGQVHLSALAAEVITALGLGEYLAS